MKARGPQVFDLSPARPEGWFDEVIQQSKDFEAAAKLVGRETLGLALIAGVRIVSLTCDSKTRELTRIEFTLGPGGAVREAELAEFRKAVGAALLAPMVPSPLPLGPDVEALQAYIGGRYLLEADLFGVYPLELRVDLGLAEIAVEFNDRRHVLALEDFRDVIDERVRSELGVNAPRGEISIDLAVVDRAKQANANGNFGSTIAMLSPWLTPITLLLRTGEAAELAEEVHHTLSLGLDLLGSAYAGLGEQDAANEVLRLGIQWAGDSDKAGDLYLALGRASVSSAKHGEAIGLLRRALRLGADPSQALPLLMKSFLARDQVLAAIVCLDRAKQAGAHAESLLPAEQELRSRLGEPWSRLEALLKRAGDG